MQNLSDYKPESLIRLSSSTLNPAAWTYERLVKLINSFENDLDNDHEIGARLVSFGENVTFHIIDMGFWGPDIITFDGINDKNEPIKLIQNINQLSVLLVSMKKINAVPKRIGFTLEKELQKNKEKD